MNRLLDVIEARNVVAIMSTIPHRVDFNGADALVPQANDVVRSIATLRHVPLIDLYVALDALSGYGLSADGVHPNLEPTDAGSPSCDFSSAGLRYGYDARNLLAVQMLDRLRSLP